MTHDKHRKDAIRQEAKRRGLPYQTVLEERWRPEDEGKVRRLLTDAIQRTVATWPRASDSPNGQSIADLVDSLLLVAIPAPRTSETKYRVEELSGVDAGQSRTDRCMRVVSHFVCDRCGTLDEQERRTTQLTLAVAPIVVRRCPGHSAAKDGDAVRRDVEYWLSGDDYDDSYLSEND